MTDPIPGEAPNVISSERLDAIWIDKGNHYSRGAGVCAMELVAWLAGEPHSDHPECTSLVLGAYVRLLNDIMPPDVRQELKPYLPRLIGTAGDGRDVRRAFLAADAAVRVFAPLAFAAQGDHDSAEALRSLAPVTDRASAYDARWTLSAASRFDPNVRVAAEAARTACAAVAAVTADAGDHKWLAHAATNAIRVAATAGHAEVWPEAIALLDRMIKAEEA